MKKLVKTNFTIIFLSEKNISYSLCIDHYLKWAIDVIYSESQSFDRKNFLMYIPYSLQNNMNKEIWKHSLSSNKNLFQYPNHSYAIKLASTESS